MKKVGELCDWDGRGWSVRFRVPGFPAAGPDLGLWPARVDRRRRLVLWFPIRDDRMAPPVAIWALWVKLT